MRYLRFLNLFLGTGLLLGSSLLFANTDCKKLTVVQPSWVLDVKFEGGLCKDGNTIKDKKTMGGSFESGERLFFDVKPGTIVRFKAAWFGQVDKVYTMPEKEILIICGGNVDRAEDYCR